MIYFNNKKDGRFMYDPQFIPQRSSIYIIDISPFRQPMILALQKAVEQYRIEDYFEDCFDFCVAKAVQVHFNINVAGIAIDTKPMMGHVDIYKCVFDTVGPVFIGQMVLAMKAFSLQIFPKHKVKVVNSFNEIVIIHSHADLF